MKISNNPEKRDPITNDNKLDVIYDCKRTKETNHDILFSVELPISVHSKCLLSILGENISVYKQTKDQKRRIIHNSLHKSR
jgi:hypothetical protein